MGSGWGLRKPTRSREVCHGARLRAASISWPLPEGGAPWFCNAFATLPGVEMQTCERAHTLIGYRRGTSRLQALSNPGLGASLQEVDGRHSWLGRSSSFK